jgi:hypothetical protein
MEYPLHHALQFVMEFALGLLLQSASHYPVRSVIENQPCPYGSGKSVRYDKVNTYFDPFFRPMPVTALAMGDAVTGGKGKSIRGPKRLNPRVTGRRMGDGSPIQHWAEAGNPANSGE